MEVVPVEVMVVVLMLGTLLYLNRIDIGGEKRNQTGKSMNFLTAWTISAVTNAVNKIIDPAFKLQKIRNHREVIIKNKKYPPYSVFYTNDIKKPAFILSKERLPLLRVHKGELIADCMLDYFYVALI
jgi:hypothetical protein